MRMKDFYPVLSDNNHVILANPDTPELYYEGPGDLIPHEYDDFFVRSVGFSKDLDTLFLITKEPIS